MKTLNYEAMKNIDKEYVDKVLKEVFKEEFKVLSIVKPA